MKLLSALQLRALEQLAIYRFLNTQQLIQVGVSRDPKDLRTDLAVLINKGWIGRTEKVPALPAIGRLPHLYWLRQPGADALAEMTNETPITARTRPYTGLNELPHLCAVVDTHIALRTWAASSGAMVDWFKGDYEPGAARGKKATSLPYNEGRASYTPDGLAQVTLADGIPRLLVIEVYRGGWRGTLSHFWDALPVLRRVSATEAVEAHYGSETTARFLVLFLDGEMRDQALARWPDSGAEVFEDFYVKHMDELADDFTAGWRQPGRPAANLF